MQKRPDAVTLLVRFFVGRTKDHGNLENLGATDEPWLIRVYLGDGTPTQLCGDYFIDHEIRISFLNNQDSMMFFSWLR